jgi:hypothetical protein
MKYLKFFLAALFVTAMALAQTTGAIEGTVYDNNKQPLPGVTVELTSPALQGARVVQTDVNGKFIAKVLPIGDYKLTARMSGFADLEQVGIQVGLGRTVTLQVNLQPAFEEKITVTGESPLVDVSSTTGGVNLTQELIQDLPAGRSYQSLSFLAPSAVNGELGNNASIGGASGAENRYLVDGIDTSDPAFGTIGTNVTFNFVQEVEVKTGGYEAEYGGAMGGIVNVVTKSGSNEFQGEAFGYFTDDSLTDEGETPVGGSSLESFKEYDYGLSLGGKIIEDKLWYFVALNPVYREDTYLLPIEGYGTFTEKREGDPGYGALKLNWAINPSNSVVANVIMDPRDGNDLYGDYFIDVSDAGYDYANPKNPGEPIVTDFDRSYETGGYNYGAVWNSILSPSLLLELKFGHHETKVDRRPTLNQETWVDWNGDWTCYGNHTTFGVDCGNGISFGGAGFDEMNTERFRDQAKASLSWFVGPLEMKFGVDYKELEFTDLAGVNGSSEAFCAPIGDIRANAGYDYWGDEDGDGVTNWYDEDFHPTGMSMADLAEATGRACTTEDGQPGFMVEARHGNRWYLYNQGFSSYFDYYNRNYQNNSVGQTTSTALFAQASWKIMPNFTLNLGVRADSSKSEGNATELGYSPGLDFGFSDMISPRIGFIWDFMNNGRSKVYGHYGKFFNDIPLQINVRAFGLEEYWFYYYQYPTDAEGNPTLPSTSNPGLLQRVRLSGGAATIADGIKPSYEEEIIMGGEYEIMPNVSVGLEGTYRSIADVMEDYSFDGGSSYEIGNPGSLVGVESACVTVGNDVEATPEERTFCFVTPVRFYRAVELSLSKRFSNNWQASFSFLWSKSEGNYGGLFRQDNGQLDPYITSLYDLPQLLPGSRGLLPNDREYQFKTYGSYRFPFGLVAGYDAWWMTGTPRSKLGAHLDYGDDERFVGARGSYGRSEDVYDFSLHLAYPIKFSDSMQFKIILDVFNVFNFQHAMVVEQTWSSFAAQWTDDTGTWDVNGDGAADGYEWDPQGCDLPEGDTGRSAYCDYLNPTWGEPLVYQAPRSIRLGFTLSF